MLTNETLGDFFRKTMAEHTKDFQAPFMNSENMEEVRTQLTKVDRIFAVKMAKFVIEGLEEMGVDLTDIKVDLIENGIV